MLSQVGTSPSSSDSKKLRIIIPFFGPWPNYLSYFLASCRTNPSVDWLLVGDHSISYDLPSNVTFEQMQLEDVRRMAERRLGVPVNLAYPMRLCNLKPMYGLIFRDFLQAYAYWAWGDIDVIYGDLSKFLLPLLSKRFDIVSCRVWYTTGELTVLRNSPDVCTFFTESRDWEMVAASGRCWAFDEAGFFRDRNVDSFTHAVKRLIRRGKAKVYFGDLVRTEAFHLDRGKTYYWRTGKLYCLETGEEIMLMHFLRSKKNWGDRLKPCDPLKIQSFVVRENGIEELPIDQKITLKWWNAIPCKIIRFLKLVKQRVKAEQAFNK